MLKMHLDFEIFYKDVFLNHKDENGKMLQKIKMYL